MDAGIIFLVALCVFGLFWGGVMTKQDPYSIFDKDLEGYQELFITEFRRYFSIIDGMIFNYML